MKTAPIARKDPLREKICYYIDDGSIPEEVHERICRHLDNSVHETETECQRPKQKSEAALLKNRLVINLVTGFFLRFIQIASSNLNMFDSAFFLPTGTQTNWRQYAQK